MDLRNTPTGKGLAAIYRQEIIQDVTLFTFQSAAMFYDKLFSSLDFTLPGAATGRRGFPKAVSYTHLTLPGFPKEAMVCAFIVMKCEGFAQITDLADYLDNNRLIAHYSRVGGLYIWNCVSCGFCCVCCAAFTMISVIRASSLLYRHFISNASRAAVSIRKMYVYSH